jgi:hypothetical protein
VHAHLATVYVRVSASLAISGAHRQEALASNDAMAARRGEQQLLRRRPKVAARVGLLSRVGRGGGSATSVASGHTVASSRGAGAGGHCCSLARCSRGRGKVVGVGCCGGVATVAGSPWEAEHSRGG